MNMQGKHFGAKPGLGTAPDNQELEQEPNHDVEKGVEHGRTVSHGARRSGLGARQRVADPLRNRQSRVNAILISELTEQGLTIQVLGAGLPPRPGETAAGHSNR